MAKEFIMNEITTLNRLHKGIGLRFGFYVPGHAPGFESTGIAGKIKNEIPVPAIWIGFLDIIMGEKRNLRFPGRQLEQQQQQQQPAGVQPQQCGQPEHRSKQQLRVPLCPVRPVGERV